MMWELWIHNIIKEKEAGYMNLFTSCWLPLNTEISLPGCIDDVGIVDSQYHQRKGSMRYETDQKVLITIQHLNKLTRCIDDMRIVDSQNHQRKGSIRYETDRKLLITIEYLSKLTGCIDDVSGKLYIHKYHSKKIMHEEVWNSSQVADYHWTLK